MQQNHTVPDNMYGPWLICKKKLIFDLLQNCGFPKYEGLTQSKINGRRQQTEVHLLSTIGGKLHHSSRKYDEH